MGDELNDDVEKSVASYFGTTPKVEPEVEIAPEVEEEPSQIATQVEDQIPLTEEEENAARYFAKALGEDESTYNDESVDGLLAIALANRAKLEDKYKGFDNPTVQEFKEHIEAGGTIENFKATPQFVQNHYTDLDTGNLEQLEDIIRLSYQIQGLEDEVIDLIINDSKDKATFVELGKQRNAWVKNEDDKYNASIKAQVEQERTLAIQEAQAYEKQLRDSFTTNHFDGYSIPQSEIEVLKEYSLPQRGGFKINEIYETLTPTQQILLNHAALKISKGEPIVLTRATNVRGNNIGAKLVSKASNTSVANTGGGKGLTQALTASLQRNED